MSSTSIGGPGPLYRHEVVPVLDGGTPYADGDVLAVPLQVTGALDAGRRAAVVQSLQIVDAGAESQALDVIFLTANVSLGTLNAAVSLSSANAHEVCGVVSVVAGDYVALGSNASYAAPQFAPFVVSAGLNAEQELWVGLISRGTGTYAVGDLRLSLGLLR